MRVYLVRRLLVTAVLLWLVTTAVFLFVRLLPGDPAAAILSTGEGAGPSAQDIARVRGQLGLDRPLVEQYSAYVLNLLHGDLGASLVNGRPVALDLGIRLGRT